MRRERTVAARAQLLDRLPVTGDILRGSLLQRTIRNHAKSCAKCASGEGHRELCGRKNPAVEPAPRAGLLGAPLACQLSEAQGRARGDWRTQSRPVASGRRAVIGPPAPEAAP